MTCKAMRKQPGADMDVGARIVEIAFVDAVARERAQVRAVDLHQPDVDRPGALTVRPIDCMRIQTRFDATNRIEQIGGYAVALRGLFPARLRMCGSA